MRPLILSLSAFGPFPGEERVDFRRLGERPLFLINGATGSGKTTLLDAICFALYGKTTGDEREGSQMRADLAAPERLTEVVLVFELAGRYYRIRRLPEQQRPKARGEGTTTQAPEAQLWQLQSPDSDSPDQEQLLVAAKVSEASRRIESLTGLNADQFRQVMVLPQGKFRQLLMAESREREAIFSQLFQTHIYKRLEENLKTRAATVRRERERQQQLSDGMLQGCGLDDEQALTQELAELEPRCRQLLQQWQQFRDAAATASNQLNAARELQSAFQRLEATRRACDELEQQQTEIDRLRISLTRAEAARQIQGACLRLQELNTQLQRHRAQLQTREQRYQDAQGQYQQARNRWQGRASLEQQVDTHKQRHSQLLSYRERATELTACRQQKQEAERALKASEGQLRQSEQEQARLRQEVRELEQRQQQIQQQLPQLSESQQQLAQLQEALGWARELRDKTEELAAVQASLERCEAEGQQLNGAYQQAKTQQQRLQMQWHQGQAAILAQTLEADQPCPVCGSREHPHPHLPEQAVPDQQQLDDAQAAVDRCHETLLQARERYQGLRKESQLQLQQCDKLREQLAGSPVPERSPEHLERQVIERTQAVEGLTALQQQLQPLMEQLSSCREQELRLEQQLVQQRDALNQAQAAQASAQASLVRAEQELPEAFRRPGDLETAIAETATQVERQQRQLEQWYREYETANSACIEAKSSLDAARQQLLDLEEQSRRADSEWQRQLTDSDFADIEAFEAARMEEAALQRLKRRLADYDHALAEQRGALKQQQAALTDKSPPDVTVLEQRFQQAQSIQEAAHNQWQAADRRLNQLQQTEQRLQKVREAQRYIDEQYRLVGTLSDVANGQTGEKVSLQRFVLSVLLDDVLVEASRRLQLMSKGRYQLWRREERTKGNKASGLELQVEDAYTGKVRPVATLSGGESFMAALSMALGLSDVVQAYSGGIRLDTLFIDEGFGSLDPESLDLAVSTLMELRSSGRMVGVISHVSELKEQIDLRLDVVAGRQGSRIHLHQP